jgi:hypothetical protein
MARASRAPAQDGRWLHPWPGSPRMSSRLRHPLAGSRSRRSGGCQTITIQVRACQRRLAWLGDYIDAHLTNTNITMMPGLYYLKGAFDINYARISGSGLMPCGKPPGLSLYATAGCFKVTRTRDASLRADGGPYTDSVLSEPTIRPMSFEGARSSTSQARCICPRPCRLPNA